MRKLFFSLIIFISLGAAAQGSGMTVSFKGIGPFKPGMKKAEVEKITGKKITLKNLLTEDGWADTIRINYQNASFNLYFEKQYTDSVNFEYGLYGVQTTSALCKTSAGIGIGTDKLKIITTYEFNGINIWPEYEGPDFMIKSKTKAIVTVSDDEGYNAIVFHLLNNKVASIEVSYFQGD